MCEIMEKYMAESRAEGKIEGKIELIVELTKDGILTISNAAQRANMSEDEFKKLL